MPVRHITVQDLDGLGPTLDQAATMSRRELKAAFRDNVSLCGKDARAHTPVGESRNLRRSIGWGVKELPGGWIIGYYGTDAPYAPHLEFGTGMWGPKRAPIRPKHGKWLHWYNREGGHWAREVAGIHVGTEKAPRLIWGRPWKRSKKYMKRHPKAAPFNLGKGITGQQMPFLRPAYHRNKNRIWRRLELMLVRVVERGGAGLIRLGRIGKI